MCKHTNGHSDRPKEYSTHEDFCQVFERDMDSLYQLALLLTANHEKAESIFVAGLDECAHSNPVFEQWVRSWARRAIIVSAIRLVAPMPGEGDDCKFEEDESEAWLLRDAAAQAIVRLSTFDRFVFTMSVLERIPDRECAALLGCRSGDMEDARIRALQTIAQAELGMPDTIPSVHENQILADEAA